MERRGRLEQVGKRVEFRLIWLVRLLMEVLGLELDHLLSFKQLKLGQMEQQLLELQRFWQPFWSHLS